MDKELSAEKEVQKRFEELADYKSKHTVRRMIKVLNIVFYAAIIGAILPQVIYYFYIFAIDPSFQLPWKFRDSFILFGAIGNLSVVVLSASSIIIMKTLGKRLDRYDQIIDAGMKDLDIIREKFKKIGKDIDDIYPGIDKITTFYRQNKGNIHDAIEMLKHVMPFITILKMKYGSKLEKIDDMNEEERELVLEMILDDLFNR